MNMALASSILSPCVIYLWRREFDTLRRPPASWSQRSSRIFSFSRISSRRKIEMVRAATHCAAKDVTLSLMFLQFCTKSPNSIHSRNLDHSPRRTQRKIHQGPRREVELTTLVQIIIRRCFTNSTTRLDVRVRFINPINAPESFFLFGRIKPCCRSNFLPVPESQRRGRASKNFSRSLSSSNESNVHINER